MAKTYYQPPKARLITLYYHEHILSCTPNSKSSETEEDILPDDRDTECPFIIED